MSRAFDPDYKHARAQFKAETKDHVMTVLHDDGVYRHLRFAAPGTGIWSWSIVTWPGHLATSGDIADGYMFSRLPDMFQFFRRASDYINPGYWAEKMPHTITSKTFSSDLFEQTIREEVEDWRKEMTDDERAEFDRRLDEEVFEYGITDESAHLALQDFKFESKDESFEWEFTDVWEYDFTDYDHHLILAMLAISHGIAEYDKAAATVTSIAPERELVAA